MKLTVLSRNSKMADTRDIRLIWNTKDDFKMFQKGIIIVYWQQQQPTLVNRYFEVRIVIKFIQLFSPLFRSVQLFYDIYEQVEGSGFWYSTHLEGSVG